MSADERRRLVVDAALREFARGGLTGTSTDAIAQRAGISQPYIFRLFPSKKDLFVAVVEEGFRRVEEAFEQAAEGLAGEEAKQAMGRRYGQLLLDRDLLMAQLHSYAACGDADICAAARAGYRRLWQLVARVTGLPDEEIAGFFAAGMLINVAAALNLPGLEERWAESAIAFVCPEGLPTA